MEIEAITGVPYASTVFFPSFNVSGFISTITTPRAPSLAKEMAIAFPSPRAPPVTKATPEARGPDLLVVDLDFQANWSARAYLEEARELLTILSSLL
jgi:hypothetical protein